MHLALGISTPALRSIPAYENLRRGASPPSQEAQRRTPARARCHFTAPSIPETSILSLLRTCSAARTTSFRGRFSPRPKISAGVPMESTSNVLRLPDVLKATGLGRSTIYKLMGLKQFPAPIKLSVRAVGWPEAEVSDWVSSRARADNLPSCAVQARR